MKLTIFLFLLSVMSVLAGRTYSQIKGLTLDLKNGTVKEVLQTIEEQSEFCFMYSEKLVDVKREVSVNVKNKKIDEVLDGLFAGTNVSYKVKDRFILLTTPEVSRSELMIQQQTTVAGRVTDSSGQPLPGVTVAVKGKAQGTVTDVNGNYSLPNVPNDATLVFSFVGMKTQEISVFGKTNISVTLQEETIGLEEVVAVGYGTIKKVNLTGAVDVVSGERLANRPAANVSGLLQGVSPNVNITLGKLGGEPGSEQSWQLRGIGSISGNDKPLILVDGVEMDINLLDPEAVESVSVLKDASASAIYGSRAAFGVVLVTTKKGGKNQPMQIQYGNNLSFAHPIYVPDMYDSYTYTIASNQASDNAGVSHVFSDEQVERIKGYIDGTYLYPYDPNNPPYSMWRGRWNGNANVNWTKEYYKSSSFHQKHNLSLNGGDNKMKYYFSSGFFDEPGLYTWGDDGYKRYNIMANVSTEINNWIRFDFSSRYAKTETNVPIGMVGLPRSYTWSQFLNFWPTTPMYNIDGTVSNPFVRVLEDGGRIITQKNDLWMNLGIELEPVKGWKTNIKYYYNKSWGSESQNPKPVPVQVPNGSVGNIGEAQSGYIKTLTQGQYTLFSAYTSYEKNLENHYFKAIVGYEQDMDYKEILYGSKKQLITEEIPSISTALGDFTLDDMMAHWATQGIFGRLNYNFHEKFLFECSARYDGSSRFAKGSRWGFFPSVSAGYNIAKENFWAPLDTYVNTLKIRGSYGSLGNQNVANYLYLATIPVAYKRNPSDYTNPGYIIDNEVPLHASIPNIVTSGLTWETVTTLDFGLDAGFLKNRLEMVFDWYNRTTSDMIGPSQDLPSLLGADAPPSNNAKLSTKGFELSLTWKDKISSDFYYNARITIGDSKTKILKYLNPDSSISTWYKGKTYGEVWGLTTDKMIQVVGEEIPDQSYYYSQWGPGDIKYMDLNDDDKIDPGLGTLDDHGDLSVIGNTTPRFNYGISAGFTWKGFDFNMFWQGIGKRDLFPDYQDEYFWGLIRWNSSTTLLKDSYHLDYWRPADETNSLGPNTDAYLPKPYFSTEDFKNKEPQTRYKLNASYLRLKNIEIGYAIPQNLLKRAFIQKARVYFSGENLLTFTKLPKLYEPETTAVASQYTGDGDGTASGYVKWGRTYPITQMFSFGVNLTF